MTTRPALIRSIPFWVLLAGSLALTGVGAWLVADRVARIGEGVTAGTTEGAIEVYAGPTVAVAGAVLMGAGLVGIVLTLAIATLSTLRPREAVEVVEPIDWAAEADEEIEEPVADEAAADEATVEEPVTEEPEIERTVAAETVVEEPVEEERTADTETPTVR